MKGQQGVSQYANFKTVKCKFFDQGKSFKHDKLKNLANLFYKNILELIITYSLGKNCPYKDRCSFAHGQHELRLIAGPGGMGSGGPPPMMPSPPQQHQSASAFGGQFGLFALPVDIIQ